MKKLLRYKVSALYLALAAAFLGLFIYNAVFMNFDNSGVSSPIAIVLRGNLDRKPNGTPRFKKASMGEPLYNRDLIWVGPGGYAEIEFEDRSSLILKENTLLFLRRIPRTVKSIPQAEVLKGSVEEKPSQSVLKRHSVEIKKVVLPEETPALKDSQMQSSIKAPAPTLKPAAIALEAVHPKPHVILGLLGKRATNVAFSWTREFSGIFIVRDEKGGEVTKMQLNAQKFTYVNLGGTRKYSWQLLNADKTPAIPSVPFEVRAIDKKESIRLFMRQAGNDGTLEIIR